MKGMIFLDDNLRIVDLPTVIDQNHWDRFIEKVEYAFFDIPERMQWFHRTFHEFDTMNSLFDKTQTGLYSYDAWDDYWSMEKNRDLINKIGQIYAKQARLPLEGVEE